MREYLNKEIYPKKKQICSLSNFFQWNLWFYGVWSDTLPIWLENKILNYDFYIDFEKVWHITESTVKTKI